MSVDKSLSYTSYLALDEVLLGEFLLYQLGDKPPFRGAVRFDEAIDRFESRGKRLERDAREWWDLARMKCRCPLHCFELGMVMLS